MARTPIIDLSADDRANLTFLGTIQDGSAELDLAYAANISLRNLKPFGPFPPQSAYLIARTTYWGEDAFVCSLGGMVDSGGLPTFEYFNQQTRTQVRRWYRVLLAAPYTSELAFTSTWVQVTTAAPGGIHLAASESTGICSTSITSGADAPTDWDDPGTPPSGYQYVSATDAPTYDYAGITSWGDLTNAAKAGEYKLFEPPDTHTYWEVVSNFNYRQGLSDFLFLGGISSVAGNGRARRHVTQLQVVGNRIPCTLKWKDILVYTRPSVTPVPNVEIAREINFGVGAWEQVLDDGYPAEGYTVFRSTGRVVPIE